MDLEVVASLGFSKWDSEVIQDLDGIESQQLPVSGSLPPRAKQLRVLPLPGLSVSWSARI